MSSASLVGSRKLSWIVDRSVSLKYQAKQSACHSQNLAVQFDSLRER